MSANVMALAHAIAENIVKLLNIAVDDYFYIYTKERKKYTLKDGEDTAKGILISSALGLLIELLLF